MDLTHHNSSQVFLDSHSNAIFVQTEVFVIEIKLNNSNTPLLLALHCSHFQFTSMDNLSLHCYEY